MPRNYYDLLQIKSTATAEEIQRAYRLLALRFHPDRNSSPDASSRMAEINEAYEILSGSKRSQYDGLGGTPFIPAPNFAAPVLAAARETILRAGWNVLEDQGKSLLLETGKQRLRVVLADRLTTDMPARMRYPEFTAVLAVSIDEPIRAGLRIAVIHLMRAERYGAVIPEGPCKSLLSAFL